MSKRKKRSKRIAPWVVDAIDLDVPDLAEFGRALLQTNFRINEFLEASYWQRDSKFIVVAPKGYGKTLLLKLKRTIIQARNRDVYRCHFPDLKGGAQSVIYFAEIAKKPEAEFVADCEALDEAKRTRDYLGQAWRNAQILTAKFAYIRAAYTLTGLSLLPWFIFLVAASTHNAQPPVLR